MRRRFGSPSTSNVVTLGAYHSGYITRPLCTTFPTTSLPPTLPPQPHHYLTPSPQPTTKAQATNQGHDTERIAAPGAISSLLRCTWHS